MATLATGLRTDQVVIRVRPDAWNQRLLRIAWAIMGVGALLRVEQYIHNRSFWLDEASLALNFVERGYAGLLRPLGYDQGAPVGFLLAQKLFVSVLGPSEYAMRLIPVLAGIATLPLVFYFAKRCMPPRAVLVGLALVALAPQLIYYSTEMKQYSLEVAVALALMIVGLKVQQDAPKALNLRLLALMGAVAVWFTHTSLFVMLGLAAVVFVNDVRGSKRVKPAMFAAFTAVWLTSAVINYVLILKPDSANGKLHDFWIKGFMPLSPIALAWFPQRVTIWFWYPGDFLFQGLAGALMALGCVALWRNSRRTLGLIGAPIIACLLFAVIQKYPFAGRLILFTLPLGLLVIAAGVEQLFMSVEKKNQYIPITVLALFVAPMVGQFALQAVRPPGKSEVRTVMQRLAKRIQPGDAMFVSGKAERVYKFYNESKSYKLLPGFTPDFMPQGLEGWNAFEKIANSYRGRKRVWFVFSEALKSDNVQEMEFFQFVLSRQGREVERISAEGANAVLYDLS